MKTDKYVMEILNRKCTIDFINAIKKIDIKEWTEIYAMYKRLLNVLTKYPTFKPDVVFDIGCGKRPTLGTWIALNIKSINNIICIDPQLDTTLANNINGLTLYNEELEQVLPLLSKKQSAIVLCNHSHVTAQTIKQLLNKYEQWIYITCPCCVNNTFPNIGFDGMIDTYVKSPKNTYYTFTKIS